jgi:hypothetical protein
MDAGTHERLNTIYGISNDEVWIGGDNSTLLHFDHGSWSPIPVRAGVAVSDIYAFGPRDVHFVASGLIYRWNGFEVRMLASGAYKAIAGRRQSEGSRNLLAIGEAGHAAVWTNNLWSTSR